MCVYGGGVGGEGGGGRQAGRQTDRLEKTYSYLYGVSRLGLAVRR